MIVKNGKDTIRTVMNNNMLKKGQSLAQSTNIENKDERAKQIDII